MPSPKQKKSSTHSSPKVASKLSNKRRKPQKKRQTKPPFSPTSPSSGGGMSQKLSKGKIERELEIAGVIKGVIPFLIEELRSKPEVILSFGRKPSKPSEIALKFQRCERKGTPRLNMSIVIEKHTTLDGIKRHWPTIQKYKDALCKFQGPWKFDERFIWCKMLHQTKLQGIGYGTIAKDLNRDIERLLKKESKQDNPKDLIHEIQESERRLNEQPNQDNRLELPHLMATQESNERCERGYRFFIAIKMLQNPELGFAGQHAMSMMTALGIGEEDARAYCADALHDIRLGEAPSWALGRRSYTSPISLEQVRKRLEWYRQHYVSKTPKERRSSL